MNGSRFGMLGAATPVPDLQAQPAARATPAWLAHRLSHPPLLAALIVLGWLAVALGVNSAQYGDHFEQFTWAQQVQWGYAKHPPLPTWLLAGLITLFGLQPAWPSVLGATCVALTLLLTWRVGVRLLGPERAALAVLLCGLQQGFASKAQLFNHNSVLILTVALVAWLALRACDETRPRAVLARWVLVGLAAGAAMLSKYQAALPLAGVLVAVGLSGAWRSAPQRRGALLAVGLCLLSFAPHVLWVAHHQWTTLTYATQSGVVLSFGQRVGSVLQFLVLQLRMMAPALLLLLIMALWWRRQPVAGATPLAPADRPALLRAWLIGLVGMPVLGVLITALVGGLRLQDHWGIQTFQFLCLLVAARWRSPVSVRWGRWVGVALGLHLLWALSYSAPLWTSRVHSDRTRVDQFHPGRTIARAVEAAWREQAGDCPLRLVRGPGFEAGLVSIYGDQHAAIVDEALEHTPWLEARTMREQGHVLVRLGSPPAADRWTGEAGVRGAITFEVPSQARRPLDTLHWLIVMPQGCEAWPAPG
ncbi:dolichyl-phosphate-mannose-protein mannosyltransferase [Sphaerotilus hippei]|uniref:Dolichyl-phosphate-mannose-protein mannosyltransferase n=1 Tax=Sphaerotilus hippei TaxID=744406 RepID=A0A318H4M7_9BURK|nr:glycosyltransferase family 39 protein [Sphaerotilus hippei]PXW98121.1 dolichyl-phosphate-mannose-protein mannosyltransferase [Sphaerotilus hippei]